MRIVVFVKQVPASQEVTMDPGTGTLVRDGAAARINPYDLPAIEAALRLRETLGGEVTAVTMGPPAAEAMLTGLGFPEEMVRRVCFLVGHHHTYHSIQGEDYRILVEADFLVNLYEDGAGREEAEAVLEQIFRTGTGTALCRAMFGLEKGREEKGGGGIWSC